MYFSKFVTVTLLVVLGSLTAFAEPPDSDEINLRRRASQGALLELDQREAALEAELKRPGGPHPRLGRAKKELERELKDLREGRSKLLASLGIPEKKPATAPPSGSPSSAEETRDFPNAKNNKRESPSRPPRVAENDRGGFSEQPPPPPPTQPLPDFLPPALPPRVGESPGVPLPPRTGTPSGVRPEASTAPGSGTGSGPGTGVTKDNAPVDDEGNLLVDATFGLKKEKAEDQEKTVRERLGAVAFVINSVNTTKTKLLKVDDLMKSLYPPSGKFKKGETGSAKVKLSNYLTSAQIGTLRAVLSAEPLNCAKVRSVNEPSRRDGDEDTDKVKTAAEPLRADVIAKAMLNQKNYYKLLGLNNSRLDFEGRLEIPREFDVDGDKKDLSDNTIRLLLRPKMSGITHENTHRLIALHKTPSGRLVIRTGDVAEDEASDKTRNFVQFPATAKPTASEEIWELPNGMRAYSARNGDGSLVERVPLSLVTEDIINPVTCFKCHAGSESGYIAGSGKRSTVKFDPSNPPKRTRVTPQEHEGKSFGNQNIFRAEWADYMKAIAPANARYKAALADAGEATAGTALAVIEKYKAESTLKTLAQELGADEDDVKASLLTPRLRSAWDPDYDPEEKKKRDRELPKFTRTQLESAVNVTREGDNGVKRSLYCAVRDSATDQFSRANFGGRDAVVKKPGPKGSAPSGRNHEDTKL